MPPHPTRTTRLRWRLAVFAGKTTRRSSLSAALWRLAVFASTTTHRSESLRTRHVGGRLPRLVGALRPPAGALQRGGDPRDLLFGGGPRLFGSTSRCCLRRAGRWQSLLVVAEVLGPSPRRRRKRNQSGLVVSSRIAAAVVGPRSAGHHQPGQVGFARRRGEGPRTNTPHGPSDPLTAWLAEAGPSPPATNKALPRQRRDPASARSRPGSATSTQSFNKTNFAVVVAPFVIVTVFTCGWYPSFAAMTVNGLFR